MVKSPLLDLRALTYRFGTTPIMRTHTYNGGGEHKQVIYTAGPSPGGRRSNNTGQTETEENRRGNVSPDPVPRKPLHILPVHRPYGLLGSGDVHRHFHSSPSENSDGNRTPETSDVKSRVSEEEEGWEGKRRVCDGLHTRLVLLDLKEYLRD